MSSQNKGGDSSNPKETSSTVDKTTTGQDAKVKDSETADKTDTTKQPEKKPEAEPAEKKKEEHKNIGNFTVGKYIFDLLSYWDQLSWDGHS